MPTGYTAKLTESGESFEDFATHCARAFGALVMLRDEPVGAPIPEFKPSPHYTESLEKHQSELARLQAMNRDEQLTYGLTEKNKHCAMLRGWIDKAEDENSRLIAMTKRVMEWQPPTSEHEGLKSFMLDQIRVSMNDPNYSRRDLAKAQDRPALEYFTSAIAEHTRGIKYEKEELGKEIERVQGRNLWVKQLRESLSEKVTA